MSTSGTSRFALRFTRTAPAAPAGIPGAPIQSGAKALTISKLLNFLRSLAGGTPQYPVTLETAHDQVAAVGGITLDTASGAVGATINGVTMNGATAAGGDNATANLIAKDINTTATNALVTKHVTAQRAQAKGYGKFTMSGVAAGSRIIVVGGTNVTFTATGVDATDAALAATAINANTTAAKKVRATSSGAVTSVYARDGASWDLTCTASVAGDTLLVTIDGIPVSAVFDTNQNTTTAALATAINANATLQTAGWHATASTNVITLLSPGTNNKIITVTGTGVTVAGDVITISGGAATGAAISASVNGYTASAVTGANDTASAVNLVVALRALPASAGIAAAYNASGVITVLRNSAGSAASTSKFVTATGTGVTASGYVVTCSGTSVGTAISATVNGYTANATAGSTDTLSAAALVVALNALPPAAGLSYASNAAGAVTISWPAVGDDAFVVKGSGSGTNGAVVVTVTSNGAAGLLYGGILGNAITTSTAVGGITAATATLETGVTAVVLTSKIPGHAGNAVTTAASGTGITAIGARLLGGTETTGTFTFG